MPIENVILTTDNCRYCLMCRHVCPVEHVTRMETLSPHGWGLTIASVRRGLLDWNADTVDVLYSCADCGTCRADCVTNQPLPEAIAAARAEVAEQGFAPPVAYELDETLQAWGNPYTEEAPGQADMRGPVALFVGDAALHLWPEALDAALQLLGAVSIKPTLVGIGRNNGYLASSLGFPKTASKLARATIDEILTTGAKRMLVLTPGDYFAFDQLYDERLGIEWPEDVELQETIPFLAQQFEAGEVTFRQSSKSAAYAYVDPTHSVRVKTRYEAPRKLLKAVMPTTGRELYWRHEHTHPCGNLALQFTQPHIANHLTYARLADAHERGAQILISEDPGDLHHLNRHAERFGLRVQGLYELLAEHLA